MSQRDYAWLWLGASRSVVGGGGGVTAAGGSVLLTAPRHKLDGPEHITADDTTTLDATTGQHGLLPKLSGDPTDALRGDGTWGSAGVSLPWFFPETYGAVGDNSTDDTTAIQAAINAAGAAGGGLVLFANKTYKITTTLSTSDPHVHLMGVGNKYGPTVIRITASNTTAISFPSTWADLSRTYQGSVRHLKVVGPGSASSGAGISAASNIDLVDVGIQGFYNGVAWITQTYYSKAYDVFVTGCHNGFYLGATNNCTIDTCRVTGDPLGVSSLDPVVTGIYIDASGSAGISNRVVNSSIEYFTGDGILLEGGYATEISGNYFESQQSGSGHAHIKIGAAVQSVAVRLSSNYYQGDGTSGFDAVALDRAVDVVISDSKFGINSAIGISSTANTSNVLLWSNHNSPAGTFSLPATSYTLDPASPPISTGTAAGGDLSGTYPNPSVVDDSHSHTDATLPASSSHELLISSTPSNPIVFADVLLTSDGTDFVYSS